MLSDICTDESLVNHGIRAKDSWQPDKSLWQELGLQFRDMFKTELVSDESSLQGGLSWIADQVDVAKTWNLAKSVTVE